MNPKDTAALREPPFPPQGGSLRGNISTAIVSLYKEHYGNGPTRCRTYLEPNLVIVVLGGGYTRAEQRLFEAGRWYDVRSLRMTWQDSMETDFCNTIERLTHRKVDAFMSANRQDPDLAVELFILDGETNGDGDGN